MTISDLTDFIPINHSNEMWRARKLFDLLDDHEYTGDSYESYLLVIPSIRMMGTTWGWIKQHMEAAELYGFDGVVPWSWLEVERIA